MKTKIHPYGSSRRATETSISYREGFLATLGGRMGAWLWPMRAAIAEITGAGLRRSNHLRLVRRNGRPVPVPLHTRVKTRNPRIGRIVVGVLLVLSLAAAGIGGGIYLGARAPAISLPQ